MNRMGVTAPPVNYRELALLAWPAITGALLHNSFRPIDQWFLKGIGLEAQGAVGSVTFVVIAAYGLFSIVSAGVGPLVARATGAGDEEMRRKFISTALYLSGALAIGITVIGCIATPFIVKLLGLEGLIAEHAIAYLFALSLTCAPIVIAPTVDSAFVAMGDTLTPFRLQIGTLLLNAILTPIFIYTLDMGTAGAALGSGLGALIPTSVGLILLWRKLNLSREDAGLTEAKRVLSMGWPIASNTILYALVYWGMLATTISPLGADVNAGLAIGFGALESFTWPLFLGMSITVSSVVGRRLGADQVEEAQRAVKIMVLPAIVVGVVAGLFFAFGGPYAVRFFAADDRVVTQALIYASILALSQPAVAIEMLCEGTLAGAGQTKSIFWATVPFNLMRVPLAWVLAFPLGLGAAGVWWAINVSSIMKAVSKAVIVARGRWAIGGL